MFNRIVIRPSSFLRKNLDLGELAEAMLFYQELHLALGEGDLYRLAEKAGIDSVLALVESGLVNVTLLRDQVATHTDTQAGVPSYDYGSIARVRADRTDRSRLEIVKEAFERASGKRGKSRRSAYRFLNHSVVGSVNDGTRDPDGISGLARTDLEDAGYVRTGVREILDALVGEENLPEHWRFDVQRHDAGFSIDTTLPLQALTALHQRRFGGDYNLTPAVLAQFLQEARLDLHLSSLLTAELLTSDLSSRLIRLRTEKTAEVGRAMRGPEIDLFEEVVLEGRSLAAVVNSGERSLEDVIRLVKRAERFREWLAEQPDDGSLIREYLSAVTKGTWLDALPGKTLRFFFFTGAGLAVDAAFPTGVGTATGLAISAGDSFLLDKIAGGWRPNQFVERELRDFVEPENGVDGL